MAGAVGVGVVTVNVVVAVDGGSDIVTQGVLGGRRGECWG
jgi:hypothetical protein